MDEWLRFVARLLEGEKMAVLCHSVMCSHTPSASAAQMNGATEKYALLAVPRWRSAMMKRTRLTP